MSLIQYIKELVLKEEEKPAGRDKLAVTGIFAQKDIAALNDVWLIQSVTGNIYCAKRITVCKDVEIIGNIHCKSCVLEGKIDGNIQASDMLEIKASAVLNGNIIAKKLNVDRASVLNGNITIVKDGRLIYSEIKRKIDKINPSKTKKQENGVAIKDHVYDKNDPPQINLGPVVPKVDIQPEKAKADLNENNNEKWW